MKENLYPYYETELRFVREMAKEFARDHPEAANRLLIEGDRCSDPHVERLIQSFALIAGRIRHKLDDEFPEITEALLGVLYPHYVRPIPSMAVAQIVLDSSQGKATGPRVIPRHSTLFTKAVAGSGDSCRFRTASEVTLWPLEIVEAKVLSPAALNASTHLDDAAAAIRIRFSCFAGGTAESMKLTNLRLYLHGEGGIPYTLYELLLNSTAEILVSSSTEEVTAGPFRLPRTGLSAAGFDASEALLPFPDRSFAGYRLLTEYFAFPQKFLFFDLTGFDTLPREELGRTFEVTFIIGDFELKDRLRRLERVVRADNFQLGCTPIVNLFERAAEPIRVSQTETEYRVVPDQNRPMALEVYGVEKVTSLAAYLENAVEYEPFYGLRHRYQDDAPRQFWYASRRQSPKTSDAGTEVYLSLVDMDFKPAQPAGQALSVWITCTNRDLPGKLPLGQELGELLMDAGAGVKARCLSRPTESIRPPLRSGLQWRLISHLALNYLSLADLSGTALRQILGLYNFTLDPAISRQIESIFGVTSQPHMSRIETPAGVTFALGRRVKVEFDETLAGDATFLLASLVERFLGLYSSVNSFTQMTAVTRQRKEPLCRWPPRAGEQILV